MTKDEMIGWRYWWIFRHSSGEVMGEPVEHYYTGRYFPIKYELKGRTAYFHLMTNDESISRQEAISFCQRILSGNFAVLHYDLRTLK